MKIEEGIEEFLKELEARGRSPFTLRHYRGHLRLFTRWLKRRESAERSDAEPSLSLDLRKIQVTIRFSKSGSPYFKEAVRLARELPGYRCVDSKLHEIKVPAAFEDLDLWQRVKQLADGVGHWKRSEVVVETRELGRYLDYDIDYLNGTLFMKRPVESRDTNFNPTYIVVDYESQDSADEAISAGGRAVLQVLGQRLEIGATAVHEGTVGAEGDLLGADLSYRISDNAEFKAEIAHTDTETGGTGLAYRAAFDHQGDRSQVRGYFVEQELEFGLGQQMSSEAGMRKFGADARRQLTSTLSVVGSAFRQDNLSDDAQRDVFEAEIRHLITLCPHLTQTSQT